MVAHAGAAEVGKSSYDGCQPARQVDAAEPRMPRSIGRNLFALNDCNIEGVVIGVEEPITASRATIASVSAISLPSPSTAA
jgi:hypothetical protein